MPRSPIMRIFRLSTNHPQIDQPSDNGESSFLSKEILSFSKIGGLSSISFYKLRTTDVLISFSMMIAKLKFRSNLTIKRRLLELLVI